MSSLSTVKPGQFVLTELEETIMNIARLRGCNGMTVNVEAIEKFTDRQPAEINMAFESLRRKGLLQVSLPNRSLRWWNWQRSRVVPITAMGETKQVTEAG